MDESKEYIKECDCEEIQKAIYSELRTELITSHVLLLTTDRLIELLDGRFSSLTRIIELPSKILWKCSLRMKLGGLYSWEGQSPRLALIRAYKAIRK